MPSLLGSAATALRFFEAIPIDSTALSTPLQFSPDQRNYLLQYFDNLQVMDSQEFTSILDGGIVTNIGHQNNQDISVSIPGFVLAGVNIYLQIAEAIGLTSSAYIDKTFML
jgi:hypothetical protein